ncbi:LysM peptidoglycan-binding domain-containing protein [Candidatus Dojkabacteria bacterium]|uniref:LysM peptidoglycan-binding domain-containing protein n=1 Tax=Candidatus Dojkabacteria bacterium TaxID=2099670 RepID=A0A5C7J5A0_9BACT|nr:MAG: LysM peptidoglycan-binding domain-containing protein [Candidatus Dojkabacteria bacterium]
MEIIVAGAIFLLTFVPTPHKTEAVNSPSLHEIAKNVEITKSPSKPIETNPTPTTKPTDAPQNITHTVEGGETLDQIAEKYYGSGKYWTSLWNDNPEIKDPRVIISGTVLKIRIDKPENVEELKEELAKIQDEINAPSPTQTPKTEIAGASAQATPAPVIQNPPSSFDDAYRQAGSRFGVPWEILYGLHHMETGGRDGSISSGYGTGAQGPLQFMPGTWASYGIDGNGDGAVDINNAIDAIFGAANFLASHGGVDSGLRAYGGDSEKAKALARSRGWNQ